MSMSKVIMPGQPSFGAATKAVNKTNEQREKELQQREQMLNQDAERLNIARMQINNAIEGEERRKVELAFDMAVRTLPVINNNDSDCPLPPDEYVCTVAVGYLAEMDRLTQKRIEEKKELSNNKDTPKIDT